MYPARGLSSLLALIVVAAILASAAYLGLRNVLEPTVTTPNANDTGSSNASVTTNTGTLTPDVNVSANVNATVNTNAQSPMAPAQTSTTPTYTAIDAMARASLLDGSTICIEGAYRSSFEFSAFGTGLTTDADGNRAVTSPYIWVGGSVPIDNLTCATSDVGQTTCAGIVTVCGTFSYAAPGEAGFGHANAYRYKIEAQPESSQTSVIDATNGS